METILNAYEAIPAGLQLFIIAVLAAVIALTYIAPHTDNKYDDKLAALVDKYGMEGLIKGLLVKFFNIVTNSKPVDKSVNKSKGKK